MGFDMEKGKGSLVTQQHPRRRILTHIVIIAVIIASFAHLAPRQWHASTTHLLQHCGWNVQAPIPKGPIEWKECGKGFECGFIDAPLDYHNATAGNITLAVGRYLATSKDRLGSIYVNPGSKLKFC